MLHLLPYLIAMVYVLFYSTIYFGYIAPADNHRIKATVFGQLRQAQAHVRQLEERRQRPWYYWALKQLKPISIGVLLVSGALILSNGL